jgi:D-alanyl-D-alanine carboxypeptidase
MKKVTLIIVFLLIFPCKAVYPVSKPEKPLRLNSRYIVVMDLKSKRVLYERESKKIVPMASTTKIMTAIVALENSKLDEVITVSKRASSIHGSTIGLRAGQKVTMEELLYGLMLQSGNDCAIAIAEHIGGSVEEFTSIMDSKAFQIGAFNTHFSTPHGLDSDGHFTTAYDLGLITCYGLNNETFCKIVGTKEITLDGYNGPRKFHNINKMLWQLDGADGVKTGYTGKAGKCLVSSVNKNSRRIVCVALNSSNRWEDSKKLLEYGLRKYDNDAVINAKESLAYAAITGGVKSKVMIGIEKDIQVPVSDEEAEDLKTEIKPYSDISAPVHKGEQLGELTLYAGDEAVYSVPLLALENIGKSGSKNLFERILKK